jgi:hypothetical protein
MSWHSMYVAACNTIGAGKTVTRELLETVMEAQNPNEFVKGSQGPSDYTGVRDAATGTVTRNPNQASWNLRYPVLMIEASGKGNYTVLAENERIPAAQRNGRGRTPATKAELIAQLAAMGVNLVDVTTGKILRSVTDAVIPAAPATDAPKTDAKKTDATPATDAKKK